MDPFGSFESYFFTFRFHPDTVVLQCTRSNLSDEENIEAIGQEIFTLIGKYECRRVLFDLSRVEFLTSSMLGKLIRAHRQLHRDEGAMVLFNLSETVRDILETSRLDQYFRVAGTEEAALALLNEICAGSNSATDGQP